MLRHALRLGAPLLHPTHTRALSTIPSLLSAASSAKPMKDAVKFASPPPSNPVVWTYSELDSHVAALSAGLSELSVSPKSVLLAVLHPHTPEYAVLLLACARLGATLVALPPPPGPLPLPALHAALRNHRPELLFVGKEIPAPGPPAEPGILSAVHPFAHAVAPRVALRDAGGLRGFSPLSGRAFDSPDHPYLRHIVTTSDENMRASVTFRSLLVYSGEAPLPPDHDLPLLTNAASGTTWSAAEIVEGAKRVGKDLGLGKDHREKNGRLVVTPGVTDTCASGVVAALMHESLWVSPGGEDVKVVSQAEGALVA